MDDHEQNTWSTQLIFLVVMYPQRLGGKEFIQRGDVFPDEHTQW